MCKVFPSSLQTFIDTPNCVLEDRVRYSTVHIPNVFYDDHLKIVSCVGIILYCNRQVQRDFLITLYYMILTMPSVALACQQQNTISTECWSKAIPTGGHT